MDGGVSGTGTHLDLLAGAKRVLILALTDGNDMIEGMMTSHPGSGRQELADLEKSGTEVVLRIPSEVDLAELMSPASVPEALALGARQASADVGTLSTFWAEPSRPSGAGPSRPSGLNPLDLQGPYGIIPLPPGEGPRRPPPRPARPRPGRGPR